MNRTLLAKVGWVIGALTRRRGWCGEIVELAIHSGGPIGQLFGGAAGSGDVAAGELDVVLRGRWSQGPLVLLGGHRVVEPVAVDRAHVVHADRGDRFDAGSLLAALITKLPLPQTPIAPISSRSTKDFARRKSTSAKKSSL